MFQELVHVPECSASCNKQNDQGSKECCSNVNSFIHIIKVELVFIKPLIYFISDFYLYQNIVYEELKADLHKYILI